MKTLEQIKDICRRENNFGMNIEQCKIFDKYTDMLYEAWETWSDDVTKEFWESDEKPDEPTDSFKKDFLIISVLKKNSNIERLKVLNTM